MVIYKTPEFENDSYYFVLESTDELKLPKLDDAYYIEKRKAFGFKSTSKEPFFRFSDRPSLDGINDWKDMSGTIYTQSAVDKNNMSYFDILGRVRCEKETSRRCVVRIADSLKDYLNPNRNTSCLNIIHYYKNKVTLFFRASDIKNELLYDLYLIEEFFLWPVFGHRNYEIHVIAATAQNIDFNLKQLLRDGK